MDFRIPTRIETERLVLRQFRQEDLKALHAYYADAVLWAVKENITKGTTSTAFSPNAGCTRAQIVTFLYRAYQGK